MRENRFFMRIVVVFTICLAGIMVFSGCKKEISKDDLLNNEPTVYTLECGLMEFNEEEYLKICVVPDRVQLDSLFKIFIVNHTEKEFVWGNPFYLEYFNGTEWKYVDLKLCFTDIGFILFPGKTGTQGVVLSKKDNLQKGKYRIVKDFDNFDIGIVFLSAEFEIIESE